MTADLNLLKSQIFSIENETDFGRIALSIFQYQALNNKVYKKYLSILNISPSDVKEVSAIPFLPIEFFKEEKVICGDSPAEVVFASSGTTGTNSSNHYVVDKLLYEQSFLKGFKLFYNKISDYTILALLPSYVERKDSSLVYMVNRLIKESRNPDSGFYISNDGELMKKIENLKSRNTKFMLWGVSFALLDLAEKFEFDFGTNIIIETGGMKGKRKEMVRDELHSTLCKRFHVEMVHSEYGMTELLSQGYSKGDGLFQTPPWMRIMIRNLNDPFEFTNDNTTGGINVIDLANIHSCSFIATQDLGRMNPSVGFEVLGRFDNSELRGCNLMYQ